MSSSFSLRSFVQVVFRHKWKMGGFFLAVMVATWAALIILPREYESEAKLIVRVGRESVSLDPTATTSQTLMLQKTQEDEINSALDVLTSRHLAELVVDELGADEILERGQADGDASQSGSTGTRLVRESLGKVTQFLDWCVTAAKVRDNIGDREMAVRRLRKNLTIFAPKNSTVITISYQAKSPAIAQKTAAAVTDAYLSEHVRVSGTQGSWRFFNEQATELRDRLQMKVAEMSEFRQAHGIVSIPVNQELLKEQLSAVQSELRSTAVNLERADVEVAHLTSQLENLDPEILSAKSGSQDPTWSAMRQQVFTLEIQEKELAAKYTDDHPLVRNVRSQLKAVRAQLDDNKSNRTDSTVAPNPISQAMTQQLMTAKAQAEGMRTSYSRLEAQQAEFFAKLDGLIEHEAKLAEYERDVAVLETNYRSHQEKLEEARIIDELQEQQISNVNVVQPATFVERPTSPNKRVIAALGLFLAFAGAVGLAFFAEAIDPTLRTTEQAESQLKLPVLSTFPANIRRRDLRKSFTNRIKPDVLDVNCKSLLQQVLYSQPRQHDASTTLGVLSVSPGSGGSSLAAQLAVVATRDLGLSTLLIDTDNEQQYVSRAFQLNGKPGMLELLSNEAAEADCIQRICDPNFAVISSAAQGRSGALKLDPRNVGTRLQSLKRQYDLVIVDLPPATSASDGVSLSGLLDQVLLVVESEKTVGASAQRVQEQLLRSKANLSGTVLTKTREYLPRWMNGAV